MIDQFRDSVTSCILDKRENMQSSEDLRGKQRRNENMALLLHLIVKREELYIKDPSKFRKKIEV